MHCFNGLVIEEDLRGAEVFRRHEILDRLLKDLHEVGNVVIDEGGVDGCDESGLALVNVGVVGRDVLPRFLVRLLLSHHFLILYVLARVDAQLAEVRIDLVD